MIVMPGLVPGIHVFAAEEDVDGRDKPGHDREKKTSNKNKREHAP
jgi:hypothetical protein